MPPGIDDRLAAWVGSVTGSVVVDSERLVGGMSSEMFMCRLVDGTNVVVRDVSRRGSAGPDPGLVGREAAALELLAGSTVPAPRHLGSDPPTGRLVMSWMPGALRADSDFLRHNVRPIAVEAARIAATRLVGLERLARWEPWAPPRLAPPGWGTPLLWSRAIGVFEATPPPPPTSPTLVHRDFHPLNLLWDGDEIVGVVDWPHACTGHPHAELGHCRWNLAVMAGPDVADEFLDHYLRITDGSAYSPWWDLATVLGLLPGPIGNAGWLAVGRTDLTAEVVASATELFLAGVIGAIP